jgi:ribosome-associated toxin RatA of RatAB toxin-antitoxin module
MTVSNMQPRGQASLALFVSVVIAALACSRTTQTLTAATDPQSATDVTVRQERGIYFVRANFTIPEPASLALAVLTDYERIPRFMPQVKTSVVRERSAARAVVEQEAVASMMMFSKRIHLLLEVQESTNTVTFRDMAGSSFSRYEGAWSLAEGTGTTNVVYELHAKPSFAVPDFLLKRLLKRDANEMIERLMDEITTRHTAMAREDGRDHACRPVVLRQKEKGPHRPRGQWTLASSCGLLQPA